jgi:hypothetical protein
LISVHYTSFLFLLPYKIISIFFYEWKKYTVLIIVFFSTKKKFLNEIISFFFWCISYGKLNSLNRNNTQFFFGLLMLFALNKKKYKFSINSLWFWIQSEDGTMKDQCTGHGKKKWSKRFPNWFLKKFNWLINWNN